jgi:hypothetical protein
MEDCLRDVGRSGVDTSMMSQRRYDILMAEWERFVGNINLPFCQSSSVAESAWMWVKNKVSYLRSANPLSIHTMKVLTAGGVASANNVNVRAGGRPAAEGSSSSSNNNNNNNSVMASKKRVLRAPNEGTPSPPPPLTDADGPEAEGSVCPADGDAGASSSSGGGGGIGANGSHDGGSNDDGGTDFDRVRLLQMRLTFVKLDNLYPAPPRRPSSRVPSRGNRSSHWRGSRGRRGPTSCGSPCASSVSWGAS